MATLSNFRGSVGEVILQFVKPTTFYTVAVLIPVLLISTVLFTLALRDAAILPLTIMSIALFARIAIPAARGRFDSGLLSLEIRRGEVTRFTFYYILLSIGWLVPWFGLIWLIGTSDTAIFSPGPLGMPLEGISFGVRAYLSLLMVAIFLVCPALVGLVSTARVCGEFESLGETLRWLNERRSDIVPFFAGVIGGMIVFLAIYGPIFLVALSLLAKFDIQIFVAGAALSWLVPSAAGIVLLGRMSGAFFAASESGGHDASPRSGHLPSPHTTPGSAEQSKAIAIALAAKYGVSVKQEESAIELEAGQREQEEQTVQRRLAHLRKLPPAEGFAQLQTLRAEYRTNPWPVLELLRMHVEQGDRRQIIALFPTLVDLARSTELELQTVNAFHSFDENTRAEMIFLQHTLRRLDEICMKHGAFQDAWWCVEQLQHRFGALEVDTQRRCFQIAEAAGAKGSAQETVALYERFIATFPNSSFVDYARKCAEQERERGSENSLPP